MITDINEANEKIAELQAQLDEVEAELIQIEYIIGEKVALSTSQIEGRSGALINRFNERNEPQFAQRAQELKNNAANLAKDIKEFIASDLEM